LQRAIKEFGALDVLFADAGVSGSLIPLLGRTIEASCVNGQACAGSGGRSSTCALRNPI
jgi:hypothetical protein